MGLATGVIRFRWFILIGMSLLTAFMVSQFRYLQFDTSTESFFHESDPTLVAYNEFRDQFGRDEMLLIMVQSKDLFKPEFLNKLKAFHETLENRVPNLNDISNLINARSTKGREGELIVKDLFETIPSESSTLLELKKEALNNTSYRNLILSEDGKSTTILIKTEAFSSVGVTYELISLVHCWTI